MSTPSATSGDGVKTLILADSDISSLADWASSIDVLRRAYSLPADPASVPPRTMARGSGVWLRSLTAISPLSGYMGCKLIAASMRARSASYLISLFNQETMNLDALLDGNQVTGIRTAATAVVAIDVLAPVRPLRVAVLGSGFEARSQLTALLSARAIERVRVFSPTPEKRLAFVERFRQQYQLMIEPSSDAQSAVAGSDVVICAARARAELPVLLGAWLEPGMTITSIGSTLPEQREVDEDVIARADLIVADMPDEVADQTGDLIAASKAGIEFGPKIVSLGDIVARRHGARQAPSDIVLYKSVGSALQDIVIAEMLLMRARQQGLGSVLPVTIAPVKK